MRQEKTRNKERKKQKLRAKSEGCGVVAVVVDGGRGREWKGRKDSVSVCYGQKRVISEEGRAQHTTLNFGL